MVSHGVVVVVVVHGVVGAGVVKHGVVTMIAHGVVTTIAHGVVTGITIWHCFPNVLGPHLQK